MQLKEHVVETPAEVTPADPDTPNNAERNRQAAAFISAGRAAIERALSNDSQKFLTQHRQKGGE
jgi:hypothetical protein